MQNILLVGLVLTGLLGAGAVVGIGAVDDYYGHHMMNGMHYQDCYEHEECEYEGEECLEHSEEECIKEHEDCDHHGQTDERMCPR
ncbi:MAG: hypothetical protein JSV56_00105 [Methanomassiliicoccales archaeon]|nr:MAG: hypothetical protein JSV56_00105 [Methanomassiliicoccales archaeon]